MKSTKYRFVKHAGFTLVELIISVSVLALLVAIGIFVLNPLKQVNKALNAQRVSDLQLIGNHMETYYNDHQGFPTTLPFGHQWSSGSTVYMSKVPQDPQASSNGGYLYFADTSSSVSQWGVIFSKLSDSTTGTTCELSPSCAPANYSSTQWACKVFGTPDCATLSQATLPGAIIANNTSNNQTNQSSQNSNGNATGTQVTFCHNNSSSGGTGYTQETTNASADVGGHDGHSGDIIPPFSYSCTNGTCQYPGKNWTTANQSTYNNNCVAVPTQTPTPCPYMVGSYCLDDTKFLQTYAVITFPYPGFPAFTTQPDQDGAINNGWMVDVSFRPDFGGNTVVDGFGYSVNGVPATTNADTDLWAAYIGEGTCGLPTSTCYTAQRAFTSKYMGFISMPFEWSTYVNGCGKTIYWRIANFRTGIRGVNYDSNQYSPTYTSTVDCTTKVGVISQFLWWQNPPSDLNNDGIVDWNDYIIGILTTKFRSGGWQPPE